MAFVHQVYFWLKNPDQTEDQQALINGLRKLGSIETLTSFHVGKAADTDRPVIDRSYHASLLCIFDDIEGHNTYQVHPVHLDFVKECSSLWEKVVIYDAIDA